MAVRKLIIFKHNSKLGNTPASRLFERVEVKKNDPLSVSRSFKDYTVTINHEDLPKGVTIIEKI